MIVDIEKIVDTLKRNGSVVAIKTDTVYGLVCNAYDKDSTDKIYKLKSREKKKPLSLFVKDIDEVKKYVSSHSLTSKNVKIMEKYWPGALTIIFEKKDDTFSHFTEGVSGIGIRIPDDEILKKILSRCDFPLAETSCNLSGEEPYDDIKAIREKFDGKVDLIVDGGKVLDNRPSTVISLEANELLVIRKGSIDIDV
ncbi:MAG: threonylcarbamoyl-AMP synthase [Lachnospiraceae bacterium]|nr:threonylcarbamoyl-AMP synthase [Lachnospiraceae bacterium]